MKYVEAKFLLKIYSFKHFRLTLHVDEELRHLAYTALQILIVDFPEYRQDIIDGFIDYVLRDVQVRFIVVLQIIL